MNRFFKTVIFVLTLAAVLIFNFALKEWPDEKRLENISNYLRKPSEMVGKYPPSLSIELLNGEIFSLSEKIGKRVIIINFFATWCGPCKKEMPEFQRFYDSNKDNIFMIAIEAGGKHKEVENFKKGLHLSFPIAVDETTSIVRSFQVESYPTTVLIGVDGRIKLYEVGMIENADIAFGIFLSTAENEISAKGGISSEDYLKALESGEKTSADRKTVKLTERGVELARRIECPECGKPISGCYHKSSREIKRKLASMSLEGKSDEEILSEIFLTSEAEQ